MGLPQECPIRRQRTLPLALFTPSFLLLNKKMANCSSCGKLIKPWFEVCIECRKIRKNRAGTIPEPVVAKNFMEDMGINGWR